MLAGFIVIGQAAGTYRLSEILADPPTGTAVDVALVLMLLGAFTKSAQYPFHGWLPGAMVAPTPVSAYLHSATMVKAGVYLIARLVAGVRRRSALWRPLVVSVGLVTMIVGGLRALRQTDLKLLLAMGTVSQLGFMVAVFGLGTPEPSPPVCACCSAHGLFKAAAFMVVGDPRPPARHPRPAPTLPRSDRGWALDDGRHGGGGGVDGRRAARVRVHRQGGRARGVRRRDRAGAADWRCPVARRRLDR